LWESIEFANAFPETKKKGMLNRERPLLNSYNTRAEYPTHAQRHCWRQNVARLMR